VRSDDVRPGEWFSTHWRGYDKTQVDVFLEVASIRLAAMESTDAVKVTIVYESMFGNTRSRPGNQRRRSGGTSRRPCRVCRRTVGLGGADQVHGPADCRRADPSLRDRVCANGSTSCQRPKSGAMPPLSTLASGPRWPAAQAMGLPASCVGTVMSW
jgi:hypothetical protein